MSSALHCPQCGAELPAHAPKGLCLKCLLGAALGPSGAHADGQPGTPQSQPDAGHERIGRYRLLEKIGEGGCGIVYLAEQEQPVRRRVALKVIKLGMDTRQVIARFEAERQALALMDHPNIAKVLDGGATETGRPYFVMELVRGIPVTRFCDEHQLSLGERLSLFIQVCQAIQHAHQKGIIHRDIKPSNILVADHDGVPVPKVIDFGIAKATAGQPLTDKTLFTAFEQFIGTPAYMSPEQATLSGLDVDTRSDIYSLGVLLYELLTGKTPFEPKSLVQAGIAEVCRIIREEDPPRPSTRLSTLGQSEQTTVAEARKSEPPRLVKFMRGDLDWIVMKCLEKDRSRRYGAATDLALDLHRFLSGEAVLAAPLSRGYRLKKFVRRHRLQVGAAAVVVTALLLGMAGTGLELKRALRAESNLTTQLDETQKLRKAEKARADELKQVSDFQEKLLAQVDPTEAGLRLTRDVNRRFAEALAKAGVPEADRPKMTNEFRRDWARVNATDAATAIIDETILRPAVKAIEAQFQDQPKVDAQLRQTLADRYFVLGLYDAALPLQTRALETRRRVLGEEHPDTLQSLTAMGLLLRAQRKFAEAEPYLFDALAKRRRVLGQDHLDTLKSIAAVGVLLQERGKFPEAETYLRDVLEKSRRILGQEAPETLDAINNLGSLLQAQGKLTEAEPYCREAMEKRRRVLGEDDRDTMVSICNLGLLLQDAGKPADAEPFYREALEKYRRVLGEEHPETLILLNNMGTVLQEQGKLDQAEPYLRETLETRRRLLGNDHPDTLVSLNNLGSLLKAQGKLEEAERCCHEVIGTYRRSLGEEHPDTLSCIYNLAVVLQDERKLGEAETYSREVLEKRRRVLGGEHPNTLRSIAQLGSVLRAEGKQQEAIDLLSTAEPAARKAFTGGNAPLLARFLTTAGRARLSLGYSPERFSLAESNLLEAQPILVKAFGEKHTSTVGCVQGLIDLYSAWDKAEPGKGYGAKALLLQSNLTAIQNH